MSVHALSKSSTWEMILSFIHMITLEKFVFTQWFFQNTDIAKYAGSNCKLLFLQSLNFKNTFIDTKSQILNDFYPPTSPPILGEQARY